MSALILAILSAAVSAAVPSFEIGINGKILNSEDAQWKTVSQTSGKLSNGGTVETTKFLGRGQWSGLELEEIIIKVSNYCSTSPDSINGDDKFKEDLHMDSYDIYDLFFNIEHSYDVMFSENAYITIKTLRELYQYVLTFI